VYVDTGIRKSSDIVKALAMGAKAVLLGRPVLFGLACGGADGLTDMLNAMKDNLSDDLRALGVRSVSEVTRDVIYWKDHERLFQGRHTSMNSSL
jgi:isopentenyl diphosphate isomerase/L-lactate dehydrogenase-like FMN-dependent dehydrogenase